MNASTDSWVRSYEHLQHFPRANEALDLLKRIASLVKPIMRKHGWMLPTLAEFFPDQTNLLGMNVNGGQKILIRLRPHYDQSAFMQEEELLGTMLHELTHNVHGPHDERFYAFLDQLQDELAELQRRGYSGEGFYSNGHRLGGSGGLSHNVPEHIKRLRAVEARNRQQGLLGTGGGARLGGGSLAGIGLSPKEAAALAATMRTEDSQHCGTGDKAREDAEMEKALRESVKTGADVIREQEELERAIRESARLANVPLPGPSSSEASSSGSSRTAPPSAAVSRPGPPPAVNLETRPKPATTWTCSVCTLINTVSAKACDACDTPRPSLAGASRPTAKTTRSTPAANTTRSAPYHLARPPEPKGWDCMACGETGMPHEFWTCTFCGVVKGDSSVRY